MSKTWLITGASRGLGLEMARAALAAGDNVVATARNVSSASRAFTQHTDRLLLTPLDVTDPAAPQAVVDAALARFGTIDVLVNNAGYGQLGLFEETPEDDIQRQLETNVNGLMRMTRAVLPALRRQRSGHIINISSIAGLVSFDFCTLYGTSKFAVEGFSVNLARDLAPFGIKVTVVEPGMFRTDFLDDRSVRFSGNPLEDYAQAREDAETLYKNFNHQQLGDPVKFGAAIVELANTAEPPLHLLLGSDALKMARDDLALRQAEIERWQHLSASTDHTD
ncbi:short-chain dehydrogenase/reductase [Superficieibacter electus]|uniref:Short-chain dehydrogenase/reductase n=1 Tax=Superficieibacter electus TaxID=2022662 RepID=A0A2P5GNH6_9ENTR|nr:oxidoreductase [Superficieibacter electus]POP43657.1 short-chain dehydrogenase/reductase [Superficieibacter electus]POP48125.1 short-chain dehydrogenase/reductase [Superficieibacter electus]